MRTWTPEDHAELERFKYVAAPGSSLVCTSKSPGGSYNYAPRNEVYPPDKAFVPTRNRFGNIDYKLNAGGKRT